MQLGVIIADPISRKLAVLIVCFLLLTLLSASLRPNANAQPGAQQQQAQQPTTQMQVQQPYSPPPPILSALIQKDESMSFGSNDTKYNILAPTKIDLTRFQGGRIYDIVSDNQVWVYIHNDSGSVGLSGKPIHIKTDNGTHIFTKIEYLGGSSGFKTMNYDKKTGLTTFMMEPGSFFIGDVHLSTVQYFVQTLQNGTGVLYIY